LVLGDNGEKLSKQNGALALDLQHPVQALNAAARALGLPKLPEQTPIKQALIHLTTLHANTLGAPFAKKA
jgi:glutamyl-Q tRNA(Asp) synthetase